MYKSQEINTWRCFETILKEMYRRVGVTLNRKTEPDIKKYNNLTYLWFAGETFNLPTGFYISRGRI